MSMDMLCPQMCHSEFSATQFRLFQFASGQSPLFLHMPPVALSGSSGVDAGGISAGAAVVTVGALVAGGALVVGLGGAPPQVGRSEANFPSK